MIIAGIDIGSTTAKAVLIDEKAEILNFTVVQTGFDRNQSGETVLMQALQSIGKTLQDVDRIASTGYGRRSLKISQKNLPEIVCHARGTHCLFPAAKTIIDIGGQDSKVIEIGENGIVSRFEMNDKCAAGTGRFLEVLTERLLNIKLDDLGPLALKSESPSVLSSICTVFAESEVISLLSSGVPTSDIAAGMHLAIARRVVNMGRASQIPFEEPIVFTGGVALNAGACKALKDVLQKPVTAIENPQITAALGVALAARLEFQGA
jgi:(R)-2-hydroxyacyl-CoA dehydratese activating ATPase